MDLGLTGKIALVTGSTKGIGFAIASVLAQEGCDVVINGREPAGLHAAYTELSGIGPRIRCAAGDVCKRADAVRIVDHCKEQFGRIDILVSNVGGILGGARLLESTDEDWERVISLNLLQVVTITRLAVAQMPPSGGAVVNIGSVSGAAPQIGRSGQYGSAKAALAYLGERWALEFAPRNIRVNTVSPGSVICPGNSWDRYRLRNPNGFEEYQQMSFPMGRLGTPKEIGDVVAFVCSPRASWLNGQNIQVDGLQQPYDIPERRLNWSRPAGAPSGQIKA